MGDKTVNNNIDIRKQMDHYVVYVNGEFFCTADTIVEACKELEREGYVM